MDGEDETTHWLEKITADPMADAVAGAVLIAAISAPAGRGRYQQATVELVAEASGVEPRVVHTVVVFDTRHWPEVGRVVPARISPSHADALEVDWDALAR